MQILHRHSGVVLLEVPSLREAVLREADLRWTNLRWTNLREADLREADLDPGEIARRAVYPDGAFIAWKKCLNDTLVKLYIYASAQRVGGLVSRKLRVSKAKVLDIRDKEGNQLQVAYSGTFPGARGTFTYRLGEVVECSDFNSDPRIECAEGIHCFLTRQEAEDWNL